MSELKEFIKSLPIPLNAVAYRLTHYEVRYKWELGDNGDWVKKYYTRRTKKSKGVQRRVKAILRSGEVLRIQDLTLELALKHPAPRLTRTTLYEEVRAAFRAKRKIRESSRRVKI